MTAATAEMEMTAASAEANRISLIERARNAASTVRETIGNALQHGREAGAIAMTGAVLLTGCSDDDEIEIPQGITTQEQEANCKDTQWGHPATNRAKYNVEAFLPRTYLKKGELDSPDKVPEYIANLFKEPLAGNGELESFITIMALVVDPATQGVGMNPDYDYLTARNTLKAAYGAPGGKEQVIKDCLRAQDVLSQVASYNANWADNGVIVTQFTAIRDKDNNIIDMRQEDVPVSGVMHGIELSFPATGKKLNDFPKMFIPTNEKGQWDGRILSRDVTLGKNANAGGDTPVMQVTPGEGQPADIKVNQNGDIEITTTDPKTGEKRTEVVNCGNGGCNAGDVVELPNGGGTLTIPEMPTPTPGCGDTNSCPPVTVQITPPAGTTPTPTTVPGTPPTTRVTTTTTPRGVTTTTAPATTVPQTTTTAKTTTTVPKTTTTVPPTTTPPTTVVKPPIECDPVIDNCVQAASFMLRNTVVAQSSPSIASAVANLNKKGKKA